MNSQVKRNEEKLRNGRNSRSATLRGAKYWITIALGCMVGAVLLYRCKTPTGPIFEAPLFKNLGEYKRDATSRSSNALAFFNQGLIMANAFNHIEAARSFKQAVKLDSTFALAHWGIAYVLGPNYNTAGNMGEVQEIRTAVANALKYADQTQPWEQALIKAIAIKFPADTTSTDGEGYAEAMRLAFRQFPDDDLIATLFAESIMNLHAWDLYTRKGGEPKPWTPEIVSTLEKALSVNPANPLANHLYIHAMEAAPDVEKALISAKRLQYLVPGAGHLVHMPSHIYINTGDYYEGSLANEAAVKVDSAYVAECNATGVYPQMYYPHNYHFLAATAALEGRGARSIEASFRMAQIIDKFYLEQPGFETTQHFITIPYNVLVKFSQWEKILVLPRPDHGLPYPLAIWHYARGMAFANTGKHERAAESLDSLEFYGRNEALKTMLIFEMNSMSDVAQIAILNLKAEIAWKKNNLETAADLLRQAIMIEDNFNYTEPPDWFFSVRHSLGDLYLQMGKYTLAEQMYREDLAQFPRNGFALNGLYHSLVKQNRNTEAEPVRIAFEEAWRRADSKLLFSRIDEAQRTDLVLKITESAPNTLIFLAGTVCK
jgi:tetratricopeptide (TPR) repeat protein